VVIRFRTESGYCPKTDWGQIFESAVKSRRCVVGESPIQGRISDPP
jgi:hypothetical protein